MYSKINSFRIVCFRTILIRCFNENFGEAKKIAIVWNVSKRFDEHSYIKEMTTTS